MPRISRLNSFPSSRSHAAGALLRASIAAMVFTLTPAHAQDAEDRDARFTEYLKARGLDDLRSAYLLERLQSTTGAKRTQAAEELGRVYVTMLGKTTDPARRRELERQSRELLESVPEAESFALRLDLYKATYLQAEALAERFRLRMASADERAEAERILRDVAPKFLVVAQRLNARVDTLEKREATDRGFDEAMRDQLSESRRLRSLARYYAGWSSYYTSLVTGDALAARESLAHFGSILGAPIGKPADVDKVGKSMLRFEHVARAALGAAMCESLLKQPAEAQRWLALVENAEDVAPAVRDQVFSRTLGVLAENSRFSDMESELAYAARASAERKSFELSLTDARLIAVACMEAQASPQAPKGNEAESLRRVVKIAVGRLVELGELGHVLDLVNRYGSAPIGDDGFVVRYIRAVQVYEKARAGHAASLKAGESQDKPAFADAVLIAYRDAAGLLKAAYQSDDASRFAGEAQRVKLMEGLSLYYAGELASAADSFEQTAGGPQTPVAQDALWFGVVALDLAIERGKTDLVPRRDGLAMLYLERYPRSDNAAKLLLRRTGLMRDDKAAEVLLSVPRASSVYLAARRQGANLLFRAFRSTVAGPDREFIAQRFLSVADELLTLAREDAIVGADHGASRQATEEFVLRARQIAEVALASAVPDIARAKSALDALIQGEQSLSLDLRSVREEMTFRRMQIALAETDWAAADALLAELSGGAADADSPQRDYARAAERLMYRHALELWRRDAADTVSARRAIEHGTRVLESLEAQGESKIDGPHAAIADAVAEVAAALHKASPDETLRDLAIRLDERSMHDGLRIKTQLYRLANLAEEAGRVPLALDAWRILLAALDDRDPTWFEARYQSLRLLALSDQAEARALIEEHAALYPQLGPEPWGPKLAALRDQLGSAPISPPRPGAPLEGDTP